MGKAEVLIDGTDVAILGLGPMIAEARDLAARWSGMATPPPSSIPRFVKPLDREMLELYASRVAAFVTFEDHVKMGGFGSAVIEALQDMGSVVPVVRIGWPDQFIEHGKVDALRAKYGLTAEAAQLQVLPLLAHRQPPDTGGPPASQVRLGLHFIPGAVDRPCSGLIGIFISRRASFLWGRRSLA